LLCSPCGQILCEILAAPSDSLVSTRPCRRGGWLAYANRASAHGHPPVFTRRATPSLPAAAPHPASSKTSCPVRIRYRMDEVFFRYAPSRSPFPSRHSNRKPAACAARTCRTHGNRPFSREGRKGGEKVNTLARAGCIAQGRSKRRSFVDSDGRPGKSWLRRLVDRFNDVRYVPPTNEARSSHTSTKFPTRAVVDP